MDGRNPSSAPDLEHWKEFYRTFDENNPSLFAVFSYPKIKGAVVDIGCGNERDSKYLRGRGEVIGIDPATVGGSAEDLPKADSYYARFLFHAIDESLEDKILEQIRGSLFAESRAEGDTSFSEDHFRRPINPEKFISKLIDLDYKINYAEVGRGFAPYKDQDPLIFRVIAWRE